MQLVLHPMVHDTRCGAQPVRPGIGAVQYTPAVLERGYPIEQEATIRAARTAALTSGKVA